MRNSKRLSLTAVGRWLGWAIVCLVLVGCQPSITPENLTIRVSQVFSGQELETVGLPNQPEITERLTLAGIATPKPNLKPWGEAAKVRLEELTNNRTLRIETEVESQSQSRRVYLWHDGQLLNELLVAEGYAIVQPSPSNEKYRPRLNYAQDRARILGLGVWNPEKPLRQLTQNPTE
ncbi:MAG TPA: thermonuclease family protein [Thermosynechococcaceae cyanobacterium]